MAEYLSIMTDPLIIKEPQYFMLLVLPLYFVDPLQDKHGPFRNQLNNKDRKKRIRKKTVNKT